MITTAVRAPDVAGDKGITRTFRLVMYRVAAFVVLDVIAKAAHETAEEVGLQFETEFREQGLDDLQGDTADIVAHDQPVC